MSHNIFPSNRFVESFLCKSQPRRGTRCTGRGVGGEGGVQYPRMGGKYSGPIIGRRSVHKHFIDAAAVNGRPKSISIGNILQVDTMPDVSHLR